jgi:hypothetical protein
MLHHDTVPKIMQSSTLSYTVDGAETGQFAGISSDEDPGSGISDESDHYELDEDYEMKAELADPETGHLLGKSNIANHLR